MLERINVDHKKKLSLMKKLLIWFGSCAVIASCFYFYFHVPFLPLIIGGSGALALTLMRHFSMKD